MASEQIKSRRAHVKDEHHRADAPRHWPPRVTALHAGIRAFSTTELAHISMAQCTTREPGVRLPQLDLRHPAERASMLNGLVTVHACCGSYDWASMSGQLDHYSLTEIDQKSVLQGHRMYLIVDEQSRNNEHSSRSHPLQIPMDYRPTGA